jgi:hypothetical protein
MKIYSLIFFISILISGCTSLSQKLQNFLEAKSNVSLPENKKVNLFCDNKSTGQFLLEDPQFVTSNQFKNSHFTFVEKAALLSLLEMQRRPDIIGPYSRLQIIAKINNEILYYDFRPKNLDDNTKVSYLFGLDFLLKKFKSKNSLQSIASFMDRSWSDHYLVSSGLENFLNSNKNDIQKNAELSKIFLKGDEPLTRFETFPRGNLPKSIGNFSKKKLFDETGYDIAKNNLSFSVVNSDRSNYQCNFDLNKDSFLPDDLFFETDYSSHSFSFTDNANYFLAIASSHLKKPIELIDEYYLKARPAASPLPICLLKNPNLKLDIVLSSTIGRNPSQHIKHLIDYDIIKSNSTFTLGHTLNFARHLFLSNPDRILYESKKGRKEQLNFFLQMNFPIYHADQLGEVMALASYEATTYNSLVKDERTNKQLICTP